MTCDVCDESVILNNGHYYHLDGQRIAADGHIAQHLTDEERENWESFRNRTVKELLR